ncbi:MAG TPA: dihydrofolate reductase family protein [Edaphobacter sp.]
MDVYIARVNGAVDFLFMAKDYSMASFFASVDTAIMGRETLDAGLKMSGGSLPRSNMPMYVFSKSKPPGERDGVIFVNETPAAFLRKLRRRSGKDLWLMSGGELARAFLDADLVDRLYLGVVPILLGEGIPLFPSGFPQRDFHAARKQNLLEGAGCSYVRTIPAKVQAWRLMSLRSAEGGSGPENVETEASAERFPGKIPSHRVYSEIAAIAKSLSGSCLLPQEFLSCRSVPFNRTAVTAPRPTASFPA